MTPIVITTERINDKGFRLLSKGGDVTDYLKNPVLLYDHVRRSYENNKDIILPIGKLNNLRMEGLSWIGEPEFDQDDDFANKIASKYNKGYLNAASAGIEIIEISEDPELMEKGQTLPTVTKWKLREVSITDIPANADAVKLTYQGKTMMMLSGKQDDDEVRKFFNQNKQIEATMKKSIVALNASGLVELTDTATDELVASGITAVVGQLKAKDQEITQKDAEIVRLKKEAADAKTAGLKERATTMVEAALSAKKIVAESKESYIALASASEEGYTATKNILDKMKGYTSVNEQLKNNSTATDLSNKSTKELKDIYDSMAKENKLAELKASNFEEFKVLYKAKFNKEPKA